MKKIKTALLISLTLLTLLWMLADTFVPEPFTYRAFRTVFMQYSGVITLGSMSIAMMLALRPNFLEPHLGGLDKMYRLHKWLGITALVTSTLHWWWGQGTKWMTQWGWLVRQPRGPRPNPADFGMIEGWLRSQRGFAESIGEWTFYVVAMLLVLALVKRFPYRLFQKTHKWLAAGYLVFVYHAIVLTKFAYWTQPVGGALAALMIGGSIAAIQVLTGKVGATRKAQGTISALRYHPTLKVLETTLTLRSEWPGHDAGQFAFVTFDPSEGAHPYTIASPWNPQAREITFITKALGDHTSRLHETLTVGAPVTVEGPYGCFRFDDEQAEQIWVGAGIGITPFLARLRQLAVSPESRPVHLFYSTASADPHIVDTLQTEANAAGVRLHVVDSRKFGRLGAEQIRTAVPGWASASVWFCGPAQFAETLRKNFVGKGLRPEHFHRELFEMR